MALQVRRGPTADRTSITPLVGELIWDTQQQTLYIGDGTTAGGVAAASYNDEQAQDAAASLLSSGSHTGISFTYNDVANTISAVVTPDLSNYQGSIRADSFIGSVFSDSSTLLLDGVLGSINLDGTIRGNVVPVGDSLYDLGTASNKFKDLYLSGSTIFLGDAIITAVGSAVNLPAGSTVNGTEIGSVSGDITGDLKGSVFADDSSLLLNALDSSLTVLTATSGTLLVRDTVTFQDDGDILGATFGRTGVRNVELTIEDTFDFDITANEFLLETASGRTVLAMGNDGTSSQVIQLTHASSDDRIYAPTMVFNRARGTLDSPTVVNNNDYLGSLNFYGWDGTDYNISAQILSSVRGTVGSNIVPSRLGLFVTDETGSLNKLLELRGSTNEVVANGTFSSSGSFVSLGTAEFRSGLTGDLTGSLYADTSTVVFDGTDSRLFVENINVIGETSNSPSDTGNVDSWLEVVVNGATKYIPLYD